jgi:predicted PurR-regulated permease PerM
LGAPGTLLQSTQLDAGDTHFTLRWGGHRMPASPAANGWQRAFAVLGTFALIIFALWSAKQVFVVLALAILFSFVLQPLVAALQKLGLGRVVAVVTTVSVAFALVAALGWLCSAQMKGIVADWPQTYQPRIEQKIREIDPWADQDFLVTQLRGLATEVFDVALPAAIAFMENLAAAVFVVILVVFMLLRREELRNRLIRLFGQERRTVVTTKALDEAAQRISRFLLVQVSLNAAFGLIIGLTALLLRLPYAPLWGFLAAVARFIPYVGTWVALLLPAVFSLATSDSWFQTVMLVGVYTAVEVVTANVVEPLLYGRTVGLSPIALLVAAVFWAWLWGPIGLLLSTPMTLCLFVLGRYVPQLQFFEILLGEEPGLDPAVGFYQRLLARDRDEACDLLEEQLQHAPPEQVYDRLLIPALALAKRDFELGDLGEEDKAFIIEATADVIHDLASNPVIHEEPGELNSTEKGPRFVHGLGFPAKDEFDELALLMFRHVMENAGAQIETISAHALAAELLSAIDKVRPAFVFVAALAPGGLTEARYLCKRVRTRFADLPILLGRWGPTDDLDRSRNRLVSAGASAVSANLSQSRERAVPLVQAAAHSRAPRHEELAGTAHQ